MTTESPDGLAGQSLGAAHGSEIPKRPRCHICGGQPYVNAHGVFVKHGHKKVKGAWSPKCKGTGMKPNTKQDILDDLQAESDLCRNETATDIADLLDAAAAEIRRLRAMSQNASDQR